ncbi:protein tyrosine phosphatase receptor type Fa [Salarias fasciatus]|uniref:protein tyrosine phosphatase receptor type Fa n=1 Tax=Salarias fasciatus TaxID=181472 RepID=UPI001176F6B0|nr:receptor-type tyrosine-protein phosphatase F-like [Salarias fasciatus]
MELGLSRTVLHLLLLQSGLLLPSRTQRPPSFTQAPDDQTGVSGGVASLVCRAAGEPRPRITWMKKGKKVSSQRFEVMEFDDGSGSGSVLRIQPLRFHRDDAVYECTAANGVGEISTSAKLTVLEEDQIPHGFPAIDMGPQLKVVERTRTATMLCAASGSPDPEIRWFKDFLPVETEDDGGRIKQLRSGALQIENSEESDQGKYECVAVNSAGTRFSAPANLYVRVRRVPPRFSIPPNNHELMPGGSVNLTCVAVGAPMPHVKWTSGGAELTQADEMPIGRNVLELTNIHQSGNYTCVAVSSLGTIETTAQVTVKALPRPPSSLTVTETTATSVTVTWDSGNPEPVSYYVIQYRTKLSDNGFQEVDGVATTRYSVGGLSPFTEYLFCVMAVNNVGRGPPGAVVATRTSEQAPSSPPLHVRARMLSSGTMLVQWDPPEEPNGQIQGYRVYYSPDHESPLATWRKHNADDGRFASISGLVPDITYSLRVLAFTSVGDGPPSEVLQIKTQQGVPGQPAALEAEAELDSRIMLSWLWPLQDDVIGFELVYWESDNPSDKRHVSLAATGSFAVDGLKEDTSYTFSLAARSEMGLGVFTQPVQARTIRSMSGAPPRKVEAQAVNSSALRVTWKPPLAPKPHGQVQGYRLVCSRLENGEPHGQPLVLDVSSPDARDAVIAGLLPETTYSVTVEAYTTRGGGAPSKAKVASTSGAVPGRPTMMISTTIGNTALIQWQPPRELAGDLVGYQLQYKRTEEEAFTTKDFKKTDDHFTVTGLHKGAVYTFKLCAKNRAGTGEEHVKDISTPEDVPSSYPQNLSVAGLTATSAGLTWDPPPLADRNGKVVEYAVVYRDINSQQNHTVVTADTGVTVRDLQPDTTYDIRVQAFTSKGGGPLSPSIQSRTMSVSGPAFTKSFGVKTVTKTSVLLTWEIPQTFTSQGPLKIFYNQQSVEVPGDLQRKLIRQLEPDTEYSFVLMSRGDGAGDVQQQVSVRTAPDLLTAKPVVYQHPGDDGGTATVRLPQVPAGSSVRCFYIVVVPVTAALKTPEDLDLLQLLQTDQDQDQDLDLDFLRPHIAAKLDVLPETFTLGHEDRLTGSGRRLYRCFLLADLTDHETQQTLTFSPLSEAFLLGSSSVVQHPQEDPELLWVMGPVLAVVLIVVIVIAILLFKSEQERKRTCPTKDDHMVGLKDSLLDHCLDPVEVRRLNYQTQGMREHPPIAICDLADHIERLKANDGLRFAQEYESIDPDQQFTWEHSNLEVNKPKNRYANVVAYDHSRVVLAPVPGVPGSDYINANYIDGYRKQNAYIATQGPLPETTADFWRMVWEQRTGTVVMMTRVEERSRVKCDPYWPGRGSETFGTIRVTLLDCVELASYSVRTFALVKNGSGEKREVRQFQFLSWPDHGVPSHPSSILGFLRRVRSCNPPDAGPVVAHCSAGVGRTGCFIAIDAMLERMKHEKTVDVYGQVTCMRAQRNYMVQTEDQYVFVHEVLLEAAACGNTEVPARNLYAHVQKLSETAAGGETVTAMQLEFKKLSDSRSHTSRFISASLPCNKFKNRLVNVLPYESARVCLQPIRGVEGSDYINASFIDGYRQQRAYIATQGPLSETTEDFWRMLWEQNSTIVVMLTKLREMGREKCHQYWPAERSARYQYFVVDPMAEYNMPQYVLREFKVTDARDGQSRTIRQFQFTDWPEQGAPSAGGGVMDFIGQVHKTKEQFGQDGPITVHCSAGVGRTGVFVALSLVLERMRYEGVVDLFQTVRTLRTQRPCMVQTEEQYQLCYRAALDYLGSFDHYPTAGGT